mmetsp:Transcript_101166/g.291299  ORF Transcript_101166/g.291299 Transcript_101166/m.291299 type:complete len:862 (+) Transcript_101166:57-2642(+)
MAQVAQTAPKVDDPLAEGSDRQRLVEVLGIKEQANAKFKEGDYFSAKCLYSGALELLEKGCLHMEKADETWQGLKNNMALCDFRRKEWTRVIDTTTEILARNPKNTKALYRRGVALMGHDKLAEAQRDLRAVLNIEPGNLDARHRLAEAAQQLREKQASEREQAEKMRGFLTGERLDDSVAITEDGSVRKLHGNENAPLLPSWIKREWFSSNRDKAAVVTCHIVVKTQGGKEVWTSRKPPGSSAAQQPGPSMAMQAKPAERPVEPVRFLLDEAHSGVFRAWSAAAKTLQLGELGRYEVMPHALGASVEAAVQQCLSAWLPDTSKRREMFKDVPEDIRETARRRQALQILGLPDELCPESPSASGDDESALRMEVELLDASEYTDVNGDGRKWLRVFRNGRGPPAASNLSRLVAHFRVAKFLPNIALVDTRLGLANTSDGLALRLDKTREPMEFIVGEEAAADQGEFVPPCVGQCLSLPTGGVMAGMHFEVVLLDGVPISDMEHAIYTAYATGTLDPEAAPDTTGPVSIKVEVEKVLPAISGPSHPEWQGCVSLRQERERAERLQACNGGIHWRLALARWRRILAWLAQMSDSAKEASMAGGSMYDLEWAEEEGDEPAAEASPVMATPQTDAGAARELEIEAASIKALGTEELGEWAMAHLAIARLLCSDSACSALTPRSETCGGVEAASSLGQRHARCAVEACAIGGIAAAVELAARSLLAEQLLANCGVATARAGVAEEALEVLRPAKALCPTDQAIRNLVARAMQQDTDDKAVGVREALKTMKQDLIVAFDSDDVPTLRERLEALNALPLTWEVASECAIGKEVGKCARHLDASVSGVAKAIVGKLHRLAKQERPLWVR